jgi:hypothetical protein
MLSLAIGLFAVNVQAASGRLKPGLWEITSTMDMPAMPVAMPPRTHTQCITPKDADDPKKFAPESSGKDQECSVKDYKASGDKLTWSVECQGKRPGRGTGEMVLKGDTYEGTIKMTASDPRRGEMQMTQHIKGKRLGDCK